jgi:hypothetical protein
MFTLPISLPFIYKNVFIHNKGYNYLGHTKSSDRGGLIPYKKLKKTFSLYELIVK